LATYFILSEYIFLLANKTNNFMKFTPEQKVLIDLFGSDVTYIIPTYQRPYSWECIGKNDRNNQVSKKLVSCMK
jgi:hypothetical protein